MKLQFSKAGIQTLAFILCNVIAITVFGQNNINSLNGMCGERTFTSVEFTWDKPSDVDSFYIYDLQDNNTLISKQSTTDIRFDNLNPGVEHELNIVPICNSGCTEMLSDTISCSSLPCPNINVRIAPKDPDNPNLFFEPGNKISYCFHNGDGFIDFDSTVTGIPTQLGRWESNGVVDANGKFDVRASGFGIFQVRYVIDENEFCRYRDLYTIIVENLPPLDFTFDEVICPNSPSLFKVPSYIDPRIVARWIPEGNAMVQNIGLDSFTIEWDAPGDYLVGMHIDEGINECLSDTVWHTVSVIDKLSTTISCTQYNDKINFSWTANTCYESYKVIVDGVEVANQPETEYSVEGLDEGQQVDIEIIPSGQSCLCEIIPAQESCETLVCDPFTVDVQNQTFLCDFPDATLLMAAIPADHNGEFTQTWSGEYIDEQGLVDVAALPQGQSEFTLTSIVGQCAHDTLLYITKTTSPRFEIEYGGPACGGERGFLDIFPEDFVDEYEIYIDGMLVDFQSRYSVDLSEHEVYITDSYGCASETEEFDLSEFNTVTASFDQRDRIIVKEEKPVQYNILLSNENAPTDSTVWTYNDVVVCSNSSCDRDFIIAPEDSGTLCAEIFFDASCSQKICSEITVHKQYDYYIPNVITLNSQDINSTFTIYSEDEEMLVNEFHIYDKWGNKVYEKEDLEKSGSVTWSGIMNGQEVSSGVYVYSGQLEFSNGRILSINGEVTVLKQ